MGSATNPPSVSALLYEGSVGRKRVTKSDACPWESQASRNGSVDPRTARFVAHKLKMHDDTHVETMGFGFRAQFSTDHVEFTYQ